jgi:hypothetical protein
MREYSIGKVILKEVQRPRKNNLFISPKNIPLAALRTVPTITTNVNLQRHIESCLSLLHVCNWFHKTRK